MASKQQTAAMPNREQIFSRLSQLPVIPILTPPEDDQIWEQDEKGAHFKVTKEQLSGRGVVLVYYGLSVSGAIQGRVEILSDFRVLGQPLEAPTPLTNPVTSAIWLASYVDRIIKSS